MPQTMLEIAFAPATRRTVRTGMVLVCSTCSATDPSVNREKIDTIRRGGAPALAHG